MSLSLLIDRGAIYCAMRLAFGVAQVEVECKRSIGVYRGVVDTPPSYQRMNQNKRGLA